MNQLFSDDIDNCITALEDYIIQYEDDLISQDAGDEQWNKVQPFKTTLTNLQYIKSIYGK